MSASGAASEELPLEVAIKATYLYKFAPFVQWPDAAFATPTTPLRLCVLGDDPFDNALETAVAGQRVGQRPISVQRFRNAHAAAGCHIVYVAGTNDVSVASTLAGLHGTPVLTVTDLPADTRARGVINFVIDGNHVRFDIDDAAASRNGLVISSKLLRLAHAVKPRP